MDKRDFNIVERFRELVSKKVTIHEIRVFGSRARGDATWESDLDILVIVEHLDHSIEKAISDCAWEAGFEDGIVVVPVVFSRDTWENSPQRYSLLAQAIKKEGILI
jgi:predicted nucleotidyltransferase